MWYYSGRGCACCASSITSCVGSIILHHMQRPYNGVFATHQHALFSDDLGLFQGSNGAAGQLQHTEAWCIEAFGGSNASNRAENAEDFVIVPGVNTTSQAFHVAEREVGTDIFVGILVDNCVYFSR